MSSLALVPSRHPGFIASGVGEAEPVRTETTAVVEIRIVVHAGPEGVDMARALAERLSSIGVSAAVSGRVSSLPDAGIGVPHLCRDGVLRADGGGLVGSGPVKPELVLRPEERTAQLDSRPVAFTRREYDLLLFLARNPHQVFTRGQLMHHVWGGDVGCGERTVDVHMRRLRVKLSGRGPVISTIRGVGYRLDRARRLWIE